MRTVKFIVIHCTATSQSATVAAIKNYWRNTLGWKSPGYHRLIAADGSVHNLSDFEKPTNGVAGYNSVSVHISYIGGIDKKGSPLDTRTPAQKTAMLQCIREARLKYPNAKILGHRDFDGVAKACPSFDARTEYKNL